LVLSQTGCIKRGRCGLSIGWQRGEGVNSKRKQKNQNLNWGGEKGLSGEKIRERPLRDAEHQRKKKQCKPAETTGFPGKSHKGRKGEAGKLI